MSKSIKFLLGILVILVVIGAAGTAYWLSQKQEKKSEVESLIPKGWTEEEPEQKVEQKEGAMSPEPTVKTEQFKYQTYVTSDQKFSFSYPQHWIKSEISDPTSVLPTDLISKYNAKIPVIITYATSNELIQISLMYYEFKAGQTPLQAMNELIQDAKLQGAKIEIINQQESLESYMIESRIEKNNLKLRAKEKMFFLAEKEDKQPAYIFSISVLDKDWNKYVSLVDQIFESAKLKN